MDNSKPRRNLSAAELRERLDRGEALTLLDVREPVEFHTHNIGGINIPLGLLAASVDLLGWHKEQEIIVICKAGLRSCTAQTRLTEMGYTRVINLEGGLMAMQRIGHPHR